MFWPSRPARNTAPAIGLAAFLLERTDPDAVIGMFPSDHVIFDEPQFLANIQRAAEIAASGANIVVMGIRPTRAETGYGYIEAGATASDGSLQVIRFTEKPDLRRRNEVCAPPAISTGTAACSSGARALSPTRCASTCPTRHSSSSKLPPAMALRHSTRRSRRSIQSARTSASTTRCWSRAPSKGEGKSGIYCIPATFGWNDLGSWTALYEHHAANQSGQPNIISASEKFELDSSGNFVHSKKFVAVVGVHDLVVVETEDALLITTREKAQDVGKVVKHLDEQQLEKLV